jgi:hypothetical protein
MVITLLWLPILIIPLIRPVHGAVAETFAAIGRRVTLSEVGAPTPKDGIEIFDHHAQNPKLTGWKSASKIGSRTIFAAVMIKAIGAPGSRSRPPDKGGKS